MHELKTRKQLIRYIKTFRVPRYLTKEVPEIAIRWNEGTYPWNWNLEWLNRSDVKGLIALIQLLEKYYNDQI